MLTLSDQLLTVAARFAQATASDLPSASYRACGDSRILPRLLDGESSPTLRRADIALRWFSDHWPDSATWPDAVPRPAPCSDTAPAEPASRGKPALASTEQEPVAVRP
jgi:hypothetical protein